VIVVSAAGAIVESALTVESVTTAVESVVAGAVEAPPQATNDVAIATIAITFFILFYFCLNYTLIVITTIKYNGVRFLGIGTDPMPVPTQYINLPSYCVML
jgi:hypothetical protein